MWAVQFSLWLDQDLETLNEISIFRTTQKMTKVTKVTKSDPLSTTLTSVLAVLFQLTILKTLMSIWRNSKFNKAWKNMSKTSQSNGCHVLVVLKMAELLQNSHCMVFVLLLIMRHCPKRDAGDACWWKYEEMWFWVLVFRQGSLL